MKRATSEDAARLRNYFARLDPDARREVKVIRDAIRAAAPDATEAFAYGIPAFRLDGRPLVYYAAWKAHSSLYPITDRTKRTLADALAGYKTSKGTVQFPRTRKIPVSLVKRLVKARVAEVRTKA